MRIRQFIATALLIGAATGCTGCATSGTSRGWPAWGAAGIGANGTNNSGATRVLGSSEAPKTGLAASWTKATTGNLTAAKDPDPTALDSETKSVGPAVFVSAARVHEQRGDIPGAMNQYQRALQANPKELSALIGLGRLHDRQGEFAKAVQRYQQASQVAPKSPLPHNDLGLCYARQGDVSKSIDELERAVKLQPDSKLYRNNLATVLVEAGREQEALQQFAAVHPPAVAYYNVGALLNERGRTQEAIAYLQHAAQVDSSLQAAQQLLAQLGAAASPAEQVAQLPAESRAHQWQTQPQTDAQQTPYETGASQSEAGGEDRRAPVTATPYSPGSIYHLGDDEPSPAQTSQKQSRKAPPAKPAVKSFSSYSGEAARQRYFRGATQPQRESALPQALELIDEVVTARPMPANSPRSNSAAEILPVAAELDIAGR